jgi:hypothetical protein
LLQQQVLRSGVAQRSLRKRDWPKNGMFAATASPSVGCCPTQPQEARLAQEGNVWCNSKPFGRVLQSLRSAIGPRRECLLQQQALRSGVAVPKKRDWPKKGMFAATASPSDGCCQTQPKKHNWPKKGMFAATASPSVGCCCA